MSFKSYKDLLVWQKSMDFIVLIYKSAKDLPKEEIYGLTSQLKRAALSVAANIAEGSSKRSTKEFMRFIAISYGSLAETETLLIAAEKLGYIKDADLKMILEQSAEIGRMLNGLRNSL